MYFEGKYALFNEITGDEIAMYGELKERNIKNISNAIKYYSSKENCEEFKEKFNLDVVKFMKNYKAMRIKGKYSLLNEERNEELPYCDVYIELYIFFSDKYFDLEVQNCKNNFRKFGMAEGDSETKQLVRNEIKKKGEGNIGLRHFMTNILNEFKEKNFITSWEFQGKDY